MSFNVALYSFSENGKRVAERIAINQLSFRDEEIKYNIIKDLHMTCEMFHDYDAHIFIGALGIAVRKIAPFIESKITDPAVLVIDEGMKHVISVLSGHIGGANDLSELIANRIGAEAVISTATDVNGFRSIDSIAAESGMIINNSEGIKHINAKILNREEITIASDKNVDVIISSNSNDAKNSVLHIFNRRIVLGIGCRKNIDEKLFEETVNEVLYNHSLTPTDVEKIASIDIKAEEKAINNYAKKNKIKFVTYTASELDSVDGEFDESEFVRETTGVSNVSERAAVCAGKTGRFIEKRIVKNGITISVFEMKKTIFI